MNVKKRDDNTFDRGNVPPGAGGCWFCHRFFGPVEFSDGLDTYYHPDCAEKAGVADADDPPLAWQRSK